MWLEFLRTVRSTTKNEEIFSPNMGSRKMLTIVRNCSYFSKAYWTELFRKRYNKHLHFSYKIQRKHYFDWDISNELALFFKTLSLQPKHQIQNGHIHSVIQTSYRVTSNTKAIVSLVILGHYAAVGKLLFGMLQKP